MYTAEEVAANERTKKTGSFLFIAGNEAERAESRTVPGQSVTHFGSALPQPTLL